METFEKSNVTGTIYLETRRGKVEKTTSQGGKDIIKYPVKYRITHNRKQIYFKAGFDLTIDEWERLPKTKETELSQVRKLLKAGLKRIEDSVESITLEHDYTHDRLKTLLKNGKSQRIFDIFQVKIDELTKNGQIGTASIYTNSQRFINKYDSNAQLSSINKKWLASFEKYALYDEGLNSTTLAIYLRCLRAVYNMAINNGTVKSVLYPFAKNDYDKEKFRIKEGTGTKIALSVNQIKAIKNYVAPTKSIERSRDLFLLMFYLAGINFRDLCLLKWVNIIDDEIVYIREKTKETGKNRDKKISIPLITEAKELINKHGSNDKKGFILPFMIENPKPTDIRLITQNKIRQINKHLANYIGKELKIKGLSTYVARHSYATILKNKGVPIAFISETLGHTSLKTTENYLKSFEKEERAKTFEILSNI